MRIALSFFICLLFCKGAAYEKEFRLNTSSGEELYIVLEESESLQALSEKIQSLQLVPPHEGIWLKLPFENEKSSFETLKTRWKAKKSHGQPLGHPRDYYEQIDNYLINDIHYIVNYLANKPYYSIAFNQQELEMRGNRIDHIHPLRFLEIVFTDENLKVGIKNIRGRGIIWDEFSAGLKESLQAEYSINNMTMEFISDFAAKLQLPCEQIAYFIGYRLWDELIEMLILKVPRKGDHNRYDS